MTGFTVLVRALAIRRWILLKRYPIDTIGQLVTVALVFVALFVGGRALVGPDLGGELGAVVVGYFLWTMAMGAYSSIARTLTAETRVGTLEQLYVAPPRFEVVVCAIAVVVLLETFLWGGLVLGFMLLVTGAAIRIDVVTILVLGTLTLCSAVGIGFAMGGLAVLYKRITSVLGLLQFAFVGFVAAPVGAFPALHVLPMATGSHLLQRSAAAGLPAWELPPELLGVLVCKAVVSLSLGLFGLGRLVDVARRRGVIGHY